MNTVRTARRERLYAALSVLTNRNYLPLWIGGGLNVLSNAVLNIALMKRIYDLTGSAGGVSLLVFTNIFSMVIITPIAGVLADRFNRKKLLIGIGILRAGAVLLFLLASSPVTVYAVNFTLAMVATLSFPVGSAILPDIVEKEKLLDANALNMSLNTTMMIFGPLLGGFIVERYSSQAVFIISGSFFFLAALGFMLIRIPPPSLLRAEASLRAVYEEFSEGVRYARVNVVVSTMTIIYVLFLIGWGLKLGLDVVFAEQVLSNETLSTSKGYSSMASAAAVGMFSGSLLVRYLGRHVAKKRLLLVGFGLTALDALGLALVRNLPLALTSKFAGGVGGGFSDSIWPTIIQENVEEDKRGRAFSLFVGVVTIPPAVTVYLGGQLADHTSIQLVYGLAGGWVLLTAIGSRFLPGFRAIPETVMKNED
jgi:MFS family permease